MSKHVVWRHKSTVTFLLAFLYIFLISAQIFDYTQEN